MQKTLVSLGALALLLTGQVAFAQSYYPTSSSSCTAISRDLTVGSRGTDVTALQQFLVAQNYPGGGSWMVTGYFGQATAAAVRDFQSQHNLPMTSIADSATRAAIAACGAPYNAYPTTPSYPAYPSAPVFPTYPSTYPSTSLSISSLSTLSSTAGSSVTLYGTGFQYGSTLVHIGATTVPVSSMSGTSLAFVVPTLAQGTYQLYVTTNQATSNTLTFTIGPSYPCTNTPNSSCGGCNGAPNYGYGVIGYNYGTYNCAGGAISLSYLSPNAGAVGAQVTVFGTGFSSTGNTVHFGQGIIANLSSFDGTSLTFSVPSQLTGFGSAPIYLATYNVSVTNAGGQSSNAVPFTITSLSASNAAPSISGISGPSSLATGTAGTWTLTLNNLSIANTYTNVSVNWGDATAVTTSSAIAQNVYPQGTQVLSFTHTYNAAGLYTAVFTVSNTNGQSTTASATVSVNGQSTNSGTSLSYVTPQSGRTGTQVMLVGTGFSALDNTVHFGVGGTMHVPSANGTTMYFTVPSYVSPCDVMQGTQCFAAQAVTPGTYQIYVTSPSGTTNIASFTVTS